MREVFLKFNEPFEGHVNFMYLDAKCLVSTGVGNLIDPVDAALPLPWLRPDMTPASPAEVRAAWLSVKNDTTMNPLAGGAQYRKLTSLRLSENAIIDLCGRKLSNMAQIIQKAHPCFKDLCADAQLAILSIAWGAGANGVSTRWPKLWKAIEAGDFIGAAQESSLQAKPGSTIVQRNLSNKLLFVNAARVRAQGLDPAKLYWPKVLPPT